ncbi:hypothetical protein DSM03_103475 [Leeuwenhoekiella aestuarii]|uniref:Uncharacterized protein n=1 Tax=Leeuwenhoekiella aestuarii TaxID=2249426 RepID=A0A4Q0NYQ9_9FLAO|nr:hypothetical protein [Leeuwenhoekiella aestuarii]RXG16288.1 hypothetical protein DSM03_103475 [Leeuwenhoekiella aestuarii]RXG16981.1 hypothetical protein DSM04_102564 [Leeuwenhoekiella aestuarii]
MNISKFLYLGAIGLFALTSCSDDDDDSTVIVDGTADLYATSHTDGSVTKYDLLRGGITTYSTEATDAEGIYYSPDDDSFTIAARGATQTSLQTYLSISDLIDASLDLTVDFSSPAALQSPRDLTVNGNIYVVSDNANDNGRFFVFEKDGTSFTLRNTVTVEFAVWGIEFVGNDLYAVVDSSSDLAVFTNFTSSNMTDATVAPTKRITVEGIVRTHGLDFDGDTMIMTDIAAASGGDFDTDGGFHVITNFDSKFDAVENGGTLAVEDQIRFAGDATLLGNPVNVVYDAETDAVYIAELANGGGKINVYGNVSSSNGGNVAPTSSAVLSGVSSLYLYKD